MPAETYVLGLDFGTDSVRALLVDTAAGRELATAQATYPRWAQGRFCEPSESRFRQHPRDYVEGLEQVVLEVLADLDAAGRSRVVGIGVDTTGSTPVAVDRTGTPLALLPEFGDNPNAMFVLWKDHTAVAEAEEINTHAVHWAAERGGPDYLEYAGGVYSSEWFWSKILHVSRVDAAVHAAAHAWMEHCDWIPFLLTGKTDYPELRASRCAAGHKALWHASWSGLPPDGFFAELDPLLDGLVGNLYSDTYTTDRPAGKLTRAWADRLGLSTGVVVAVGAFDAHVGAVGAGAEPNHLCKIMGTSTCDILVAPTQSSQAAVPGICGQVDGSVIPGMLGLEAGQSAFGDLYAWFATLIAWPLREVLSQTALVSPALRDQLIAEATEGILPALSTVAAALPIGADGELALDWMNGRRTPDANQRLRGALTDLNLGSDAPRVFRALVEASCFGARKITERFAREHIRIEGVIGLGGVAKKSPFIMQMMADVLNMPVRIAVPEQTCALGAAMFASVAAGAHPDVPTAVRAMSGGFDAEHLPDPGRAAAYDTVYARYEALSETMEHLQSQR